MRPRLLWIAAGLLLAACGQDPTRFYTLVRPASPPPPPSAGFVLDVQPVRMPIGVDLPELVVRQGDGAVALVETRRWISPLPDEARGALVAALTRKLGAREVSNIAPPAKTPIYRVLVDVQRFDAWLARGVDLEAVWTVIAGNENAPGERRWTCSSSAHADAAHGYEALVVSAQQTLDQLAAEIAALIAQAHAGNTPRCASQVPAERVNSSPQP